ncbi:MAG TPA: hypothetical protein VJR87_03955 [Allosphingosinicella sp.]|nr:hypothetical protein [Allosphingosinicella sp.]
MEETPDYETADTPGCLDYIERAFLLLIAAAICLPLGFCAWIRMYQPRSSLPPEVRWSRIIGFGSESGLREGCAFGAYRLTTKTVAAFEKGANLPSDWHRTPVRIEDHQYAYVQPGQRPVTLYALGATSCASAKLKRMRLDSGPDIALRRPGNWYRIHNGGEGLVVVSPRRELAWYLYFG